ncbi:hypothetical protein CL628_04540 [bacterium]|nr:hypothetical protein [bacterium]
MTFLGSTLETATQLGTCGVTALIFKAPPKEEGRVDLIVVSVYARADWHTFLLKVDYPTGDEAADKPPFIHLTGELLPNGGRLVTASYVDISVSIEGVVYSSRRSTKNEVRHVPDPHLLCRYATCQAEADEVEAAAEAYQAEVDLTETVTAVLTQRGGEVNRNRLPHLIRAMASDFQYAFETIARTRKWLDPASEFGGQPIDSIANARMQVLGNTQTELATALTFGGELRHAIARMCWRGKRAHTALGAWIQKIDPPKWV